MTRPDDWSDLAEVWTATGVEPGAAADLTDRIRRRAWLARLNFHFEACGAVLAGGVSAAVALRHDAWLVGCAALSFTAFALVAILWARRDAEPGATDTPRTALEAALRQARSGLNWARAGHAIAVAGVVFALVIDIASPGALPLLVYAILAIALVGGVLFYERHARRSRDRIIQYARALAELDDPA